MELQESVGQSPESSAVGSGFVVDLDVYSGPFDALLGLIANKRLELSEVSLSAITEEFLAYVRGLDLGANMEQASAFLDVASILVEAKSVSLLPHDESEERDEYNMEALRERDLLFARLLQYRAFRLAADTFRMRIAHNAGRFAHPAFVDGIFEALLPQLVWTLTPEELARLAVQAMSNAPSQEVSVRQLHVPLVDLQQQSIIVQRRLRGLERGESITFDQLVQGTNGNSEVVARFLAILALFKQGLVQFRQEGPFAPLHLRWSGEATQESDKVMSEEDFA
ncbi:segregation and condensation protein A [Bifidobacterium tsurumiense]|uniref:Segregation and condensation protein A n=1 Tax=Bifidobacterium tsurumiense TaxID=356829 RepID=A0A087EDC8_9BIFI|nr:ScpA family protein [Bifidobacterium tsurumiense]KFJ05779.1 ScpA/B protein [Bifidobacterium tsurumiense]MDY4677690.1 ScpA family protein [Bifidobacterium tsurumiense]MSS12931.1 segregation/condensation protein A [Bifidobacterium tsurumiense]